MEIDHNNPKLGRGLKILCYLNHYFGPSPGKARYHSNLQPADLRKSYVLNTLEALKNLSTVQDVHKVDVHVCGIPGKALIPIDVDFSWLKDPRLLVFESLCHMIRHLDEYDYFLNIEDDILVPPEVLDNIIEFDKVSLINECLHPNRIEVAEGRSIIQDIDAVGPRMWSCQEKIYLGRTLRVAVNPHSGLLIMSQRKLRYCLENIDLNYRGNFLNGPMESAFAYFHKAFSLYRSFSDPGFHCVIHQDRCHASWGRGIVSRTGLRAELRRFFGQRLKRIGVQANRISVK